MPDNTRAIRAAETMWNAEYALRQEAKRTSTYRFIRAVQLGRNCPGSGRSCVDDRECLCVTVARKFQP